MWTKLFSAIMALSFLANGAPVLSQKDSLEITKTSGLYTYEGHSYCIYRANTSSWLDTADYCQKMGGYLTCIESAEEQAFLEDTITAYLDENPEEKETCLGMNFGAVYLHEDNKWAWINNLNLPFEYQNWDAKQPDNYFGSDWGSLIHTQDVDYDTWAIHKGQWDDIQWESDADEMYFICEWDYDLTEEKIDMLTTEDLQKAVVYEGHSYLLVKSIGNWYSGQRYCVANGGYMATIQDEVEQAFVKKYLADYAAENKDMDFAGIGIYHPINAGEEAFAWVDGSEVDYTNWYDNIPDTRNGVECFGSISAVTKDGYNFKQDGEWYGSCAGYWNDVCGGAAYYLCEWDYDVTKAAAHIGDVTLDGNVDLLDVITMQRHVLNCEPFFERQFANADLNQDETVDVFDLALLKRFLFEQE